MTPMRNLTLDIAGESVPGLLALPPEGSGPAVIVIQEWWGLVPHIQHVVQRLADEGFVALAVDHYRGVETTEPDEAQKLMMGLNIGQAADDLAAAAAWLVEQDFVEGDTVGAVGFCMGGGLALLAPTVSRDICCTVAFYPAMPCPDFSPDWGQYTGKAAMVHKASSDEFWARPVIASYAQAITEAGGQVAVLDDYVDSVHGFFNDDRPEVFQSANAALAWDRSIAFLRACGD